MVKYKKTQFGYPIVSIMIIAALTIWYGYEYEIGTNPIPLESALIIILVFMFIILLFYRLTIIIDSNKIEAKFGIGLIKKTVDLDKIESLESVKIPWYYGIGIRLTPKGWLYNVKVGEAIYIKTKEKTFLIGTDDFETIKRIIEN